MKRSVGIFVLALGYSLSACGETGQKSPNEIAGDAGESSAPGGSSSTAGAAGSSSGGGSSGGGSSGETGADGGSDNRPLAQGAVIFLVAPASPAPAGKACPSVAFTSGIPDTSVVPAETLTASIYMRKVIDGEDGAAFSCRVASDNGWAFEAEISLAGRGFRIADGQLAADGDGTATITVIDSTRLSPSLLSSPVDSCVVTINTQPGNLQVKAGSMWARFDCAAVEAPPSSSCAASGYFVLENCVQQ